MADGSADTGRFQMKLKNLIEILGIRAGPKRYGYEIKTLDFEWLEQPIKYAQWLHPKETAKSISRSELDDYRKFLNRGDFCIDIGAHTGDSVLPMAMAVGSEGMVLALEPNPYAYVMLEKTARLNRGTLNIYPVMAASAQNDGYMTFEYSDPGFLNGGRHAEISKFKHGHAFKLDVATINLAEELKQCFPKELQKLKFIKIDTEGFDFYVMESLAEIIDRYRPYIKTEIYSKLSREQRIRQVRFLIDRGYDVYEFHESRKQTDWDRKISIDDVEGWSGHHDILCVPMKT